MSPSHWIPRCLSDAPLEYVPNHYIFSSSLSHALDASQDFITIYLIRPKVPSLNNYHGFLSKWPEWQLARVLHYVG
jgi:hypothetical protein